MNRLSKIENVLKLKLIKRHEFRTKGKIIIIKQLIWYSSTRSSLIRDKWSLTLLLIFIESYNKRNRLKIRIAYALNANKCVYLKTFLNTSSQARTIDNNFAF